MTGMGSNKTSIAIGVSVISVSMLFILAMIKWPDYPKDGTIKGNLYYVTVASVMYILSVIGLIMSERIWTKIGFSVGVAVFSTNLYTELFLDPLHWGQLNFWMILLLAANLMLTVFIIEKIKSLRKNGNNSRNT